MIVGVGTASKLHMREVFNIQGTGLVTVRSLEGASGMKGKWPLIQVYRLSNNRERLHNSKVGLHHSIAGTKRLQERGILLLCKLDMTDTSHHRQMNLSCMSCTSVWFTACGAEMKAHIPTEEHSSTTIPIQ